MNIFSIIEKIHKWTPKNQKIKNPSTTQYSMLSKVQKDIWIQDILLLEVWVKGGEGGGTKSSGYELLSHK